MVTETHYRKFMLSQLPGGNSANAPTSINGDLVRTSPSATSVQYDADGIYLKCRTSASIGSFAGWHPTQSPVGALTGLQRIAQPIMYAVVKTATDISSLAYHIGFTSYDSPGPESTQHEAKLWYDTDQHSDGFWRTVTDNDSGSPEIQVTTLAITTSQRLDVKIDARDSSFIDFYVNETLISTHLTKLPTLTAQISSFAVVVARAASARDILVGRIVKTFE